MTQSSDPQHLLSLGPLEREVMGVVWQRGQATVVEVRSALGDRHAYTTIMTILSRLADKGHLDRRKCGRSFVYSGAGSRAATTGQWLARAIAGVEDSMKGEIVQHFVGSIGNLDERLLDQLESEIRDAKAKGKP
jgi:predicted transcriptional regulator